MNKAVWISYDLGIKGDYQGLYAWLDDHNAIECGNSVAFINYKVSKEEDLLPTITEELSSKVKFNHGDRVYLIRSEKVGKETLSKGKFIIGKRKSNPWEGYGSATSDTIDGDE